MILLVSHFTYLKSELLHYKTQMLSWQMVYLSTPLHYESKQNLLLPS